MHAGWMPHGEDARHTAGAAVRGVIVFSPCSRTSPGGPPLRRCVRVPTNPDRLRGGLFVEPSRSHAQETPMTLSRLAELTADPTASFVLIARDGADTVELLTGEVVDVDLLADIPLTIDGAPREIFAMVPYRQVRERGFVAQDDGAPLRCIVVDEHLHLPAPALIAD